MATVYLAEDTRLGRKVAVKRLHSDSPDDAARRFEREAKVGASLSHPNLVTVFDTVADDEGVLIVMEYVEGENLAELMARERMSAQQAVTVTKAVAAALDHAHKAGVVHRDVKPANILVSPDGRAKLVDLGIATATERTQITAVGTVMGTPSYMAPEQLEAGKISKSVDIYALGAVAFELLAGRKARQGRTPVELAHQVANDPVPDLREAWSEAPAPAAALLQRAMSRDPRERPASAGQLARGLEDALNVLPERTRTTRRLAPVPFQRDERVERAQPRRAAPQPAPRRSSSSIPAPQRSSRRGLPRWIPVAALVAVLLVVAGAIAALSNGGNDKAIAPLVATKKPKAAPKKKPAAQPQPSQSQTTPAPAQSQTTPAPPASSDPAAMQAQAHDLINQGRYDEAIPLDTQVVDKGPASGLTYAYALYDLGHALRLAGRPAEAIPILAQRMQIDNQRGVVKAELKQAMKDAKKG
jgi:serine/threonine-protein kinase